MCFNNEMSYKKLKKRKKKNINRKYKPKTKKNINDKIKFNKCKHNFIRIIYKIISKINFKSFDDNLFELINKIDSDKFNIYMNSNEIINILDMLFGFNGYSDGKIIGESIEYRKDIAILLLDKLNHINIYKWIDDWSDMIHFMDRDWVIGLIMFLIDYFEWKMYISPNILEMIVDSFTNYCHSCHDGTQFIRGYSNQYTNALENLFISIMNYNNEKNNGDIDCDSNDQYSEIIKNIVCDGDYCIDCFNGIINIGYQHGFGIREATLNKMWTTNVMVYLKYIMNEALYDKIIQDGIVNYKKLSHNEISTAISQGISTAFTRYGRIILTKCEYGILKFNAYMDTIFPYFDECWEYYCNNYEDNVCQFFRNIVCIVRCGFDFKQHISEWWFECICYHSYLIEHTLEGIPSKDELYELYLIEIFYETSVNIIMKYKKEWFKTKNGKEIFRDYVSEIQRILNVDISIAYIISSCIIGRP